MKVNDLFTLLADDYRLNDRSSLQHMLFQVVHTIRLLGERPATDVRTAEIERYKVARKTEGAAAATLNNELAFLRRAFNLAIEHELLEKAPRIRSLPVSNARTGFVEPRQFEAIVTELDGIDVAVADLVRLLYLTGWRSGEGKRLTWHDVSLETWTIQLPQKRSKNRRIRTIPVDSELKQVIVRRNSLRNGEHVFHRRGRRIKRFEGAWRRATKDVYPGLRPHDLRRSFARNMLLAGVPERLIMAIGGWQTTAVFHRYAIVDERALADALVLRNRYADEQRARERAEP